MHFIYGYNTVWPIISMAIVWLILIIIGLLLVRNFIKGPRKSNSNFKKRLEKGEIDTEEFKRSR